MNAARTLFLLVAAVFVSLQIAAAAAAEQERGETFTNPKKTVAMPATWVRKRIAYETPARADIVISLEQDVYQTILPLIRQYARETGLKIVVQEGTCGIAAGALARKAVDMGGFCCPPGAEDRLPGLRFHTLGIVAKAFLVHPGNPIDSLSSTDLRNIYRGRVYRWSDFKTKENMPGPDRPVKAIARLHCQTRPGHWRQLLNDENLFSPKTQEVGSIPDMITRVGSNPEAIGWEVLSMVEKYKDRGAVKVLSIDGFSPRDAGALATLQYPFYRTYTVTTWEGSPVKNAKADGLVRYLLREADRLDPSRFGFVSASRLRKAGWRFQGNELIGEPKRHL